MKIAAKAALKKRTDMTAADNELGSTTMAGQAHAASTALGAGPRGGSGGGASGSEHAYLSTCLQACLACMPACHCQKPR